MAKNKRFKCKTCKRFFNTKDNLKCKVVEHNGKNIGLCCSDCYEQWNKEEELKQINNKCLDEITEFMKKILFYKDNQILPSYFYTRLMDYNNGVIKTRDRKVKNMSKSGYPYVVINDAFKESRLNIVKAITTKKFESEKQKINYICAIIESRLNDCLEKYENAQKNKNKNDFEIDDARLEVLNDIEVEKSSQVERKCKPSLADFIDFD